ncbi:C40 family peptidase [Laceyella tengchongensis]|jgi:cell wall-associated NlpC family hydrolase
MLTKKHLTKVTGTLAVTTMLSVAVPFSASNVVTETGEKGFWQNVLVNIGIQKANAASNETQNVQAFGDKIIQTGQKYLGTPYKYGARSGDTRYFDCSSFVQHVFKLNGVSLPRSSRQQATVGKSVAKSQLQKGDLLFFKLRSSGGKIAHVGIYAGDNKVLHTYGKGGVRFDSLSTPWLEWGLVSAKRVAPAGVDHTNAGNQAADKPGTNLEQSNEEAQRLALADKIIQTGHKYLGTPYEFGAKAGQTATFDCSSFVQYVYKQHGISLPRSSRQQATVGQTVSKSQLQKGDLVFFTRKDTAPNVGHVAIYVGDGKILHTYGKGGVRYDSLSTEWLAKSYVTAKRVIK